MLRILRALMWILRAMTWILRAMHNMRRSSWVGPFFLPVDGERKGHAHDVEVVDVAEGVDGVAAAALRRGEEGPQAGG
eukprot:200070-Pyramimonas_sp.AAC.2